MKCAMRRHKYHAQLFRCDDLDELTLCKTVDDASLTSASFFRQRVERHVQLFASHEQGKFPCVDSGLSRRSGRGSARRVREGACGRRIPIFCPMITCDGQALTHVSLSITLQNGLFSFHLALRLRNGLATNPPRWSPGNI